jgi:wyosine [tRNA(Phe)-imidazoG37] synthetase (radical SAM superfamily)
MLVFGPIPSRRLGNSLGINHIPPKHCPYACVYCQVGKTNPMTLQRTSFYPPEQILQQVEEKIRQCSAQNISIDYLTLVPDGEPTLDIHLGILIQKLKEFQIPIAVICNSTLLDQVNVQDELSLADWVSLKVDSVEEDAWRKVNRPHGKLFLARILDEIKNFRTDFNGTLVTETMLISGINDSPTAAQLLCDYLQDLQPHKSYLAIPIRPPVVSSAHAPSPQAMKSYLQICTDRLPFIDLLFETEIGKFVTTGSLTEDMLSITAVHPLREKAVQELVDQSNQGWDAIEQLVENKEISVIIYNNEKYYLKSQ